MTTDPSVVPPGPPVPPTLPAPIGPQVRPSVWPTVIGIISIVFGSLGLLAGLWGMVMPLFMEAMMSMAPETPETEATIAAFRDNAGLIVLSSILTLIAAALLLVAGIGLVRRRRWAARLAIIWAVVKIAVALVGAAIGYVIARQQFEAMQQAGSAPPPPGFATGLSALGQLFGLLWAVALPVFMLIWFSRPAIRAQVRQWP